MIYKNDFPLFNTEENKNLIYLDNAATTMKPQLMMDALVKYYSNDNSNVGRGAYPLAHNSERILEKSKNEIQHFFKSESHILSFTSGATESLNASAFMISQQLNQNDVILLTAWDHHSNILPWQRLSEMKSLTIRFISEISDMYHPESLPDEFWNNVKVLAMPHVPNTTGNVFPVERWVKEARKRNVITVIDGSQSVSSIEINISQIDADFYAFSAHKLYGPMGLGCLFIRPGLKLENNPFLLGGGIVEDVNLQGYSLKPANEIFDAGTPNVANIYAFAEVLTWLKENQWNKQLVLIKKYNEDLLEFVNKNSDIELLTDLKYPHIAITAIKFKNIHSHDIGTFLANRNIAVRVGKHCAYPYHKLMGINHSVRFSLGIYNTQEDIDAVKIAIKEAIAYF